MVQAYLMKNGTIDYTVYRPKQGYSTMERLIFALANSHAIRHNSNSFGPRLPLFGDI